MSVFGICRDACWATEEVTASSPGHKQKSGVTVLESPAKMAMPDDGMLGGEGGGDGDGGGGDGDVAVIGAEGDGEGDRSEGSGSNAEVLPPSLSISVSK